METKLKLTLERSNKLKSLILLANSLLKENIKLKDSHKHAWEHKVYEKNIVKLRDILKSLKTENTPLNIENHVLEEISMINQAASSNPTVSFESNVILSLKNMGFQLREYEIIRYSPAFSIVHDLYWIEDGTVGDLKQIAVGSKSPETLGQHLKSRIKRIESELYPFLSKHEDLNQFYIGIKTCINLIKDKKYGLANILLMILIEGLARIICKIIYQNQNPTLSASEIEFYIYQKFLSLESLIIKGDFKPDYKISLIDAYLLNQHVYSDELNQIEEEYKLFLTKSEWFRNEFPAELEEIIALTNEDETESTKEGLVNKVLSIKAKLGEGPMQITETRKISIKPRLQFLLRSFKEDRNLIVHGKFIEFDKEWKSYLYFLALNKVCLILKEYYIVGK